MVFLVVESSPSNREALCHLLLSFGIKGVPAASRAAAHEILAVDHGIEGAIIDIDNKDTDGMRLARELRTDESTRRLFIIVHTVQSRRDFVVEMIELGVAGYLLKPFSPEIAHAKLQSILGKLSTHNTQRRHIRVKPDPQDMARVHFRLSETSPLFSGRIIDVSLGGIAMELFNPPSAELLAPGTQVRKLQFALAGRELAPSGIVVLYKSRVLALRFDALNQSDKKTLERYIFKSISS